MQSHDELIWNVREYTVPAALALLPGRMDSINARAMLLSIGLQESGFNARVQNRIGLLETYEDMNPKAGPARGFWQFERLGGVKEILNHAATGPIIKPICRMFLYEPNPQVIHAALAHHDVLACCFARLLLYVDPAALPPETNPDLGWKIYLRNWRPGKPHPETWYENFETGWRIAKGR